MTTPTHLPGGRNRRSADSLVRVGRLQTPSRRVRARLERVVKLSRLRLVRGVVSVVVCLAVGCVSTKKTESLLLEAGFKITRADTPEKQAHLKSLPAGKVIRVNRDGVVYYVYADVKNNVLYVGKEPEYQQYKNDLWLAQRTSENQNQAEYLEGTASMIWNGGGVWEVWGPSD